LYLIPLTAAGAGTGCKVKLGKGIGGINAGCKKYIIAGIIAYVQRACFLAVFVLRYLQLIYGIDTVQAIEIGVFYIAFHYQRG
jgi:hypothetical protein